MSETPLSRAQTFSILETSLETTMIANRVAAVLTRIAQTQRQTLLTLAYVMGDQKEDAKTGLTAAVSALNDTLDATTRLLADIGESIDKNRGELDELRKRGPE